MADEKVDENTNKRQKLTEENSCPLPGYHFFGHPPRFITLSDDGTPKYTTAVRESKASNFTTYRDLVCVQDQDIKNYKNLVCYLCNENIKCNPPGQFGNFMTHIKKKHKDQLTLDHGFPGHGEVSSKTASSAKSDPKISNFLRPKNLPVRPLSEVIAHGPYPVSIVNNLAFRELASVLGYEKLPNIKTIRKDVKVLCDEEELKYMKSLYDSNISFLATTTDAATSTGIHPYMSITGHYITNSWEMRETVLALQHFPGKHTKENILLRFQACIKDSCTEEVEVIGDTTKANLSVNVHAVVTDAAANNNSFSEGCYIHNHCFGHRLNTFVENICNVLKHKELAMMLRNLNQLMQMIKNSNINRQELAQVQQNCGKKELMPFEHRFSSTRWTGVITLLERSERIYPDVIKLFTECSSKIYFKSDGGEATFRTLLNVWIEKRDFLFLLLPFFSRIKYWILKTESASYPTNSLVLYAIEDLFLMIENIKFGICGTNAIYTMDTHRKEYFKTILKALHRELCVIFPEDEWSKNKILCIARILT